MRIGGSVLGAQPGSEWYHFQVFMVEVLHFTSELFYVLDAAETLQRSLDSGLREYDPLNRGFGPSSLRVKLTDNSPGQYTLASRYGPNGSMVQIAYVGWVAAVAGAWEKCRQKPPFDKNLSNLPRGIQASLFGDLQRIRNDLLKNGGVCKNAGNCTELRWFQAGERMHMRVEHVLDYLHRMGSYLRSQMSWKDQRSITWCYDEAKGSVGQRGIISNRVGIEEIPGSDEKEFGLFISMVFDDGVAVAALLRKAPTREALQDEYQAALEAPTDGRGALVPSGPDVSRTYEEACKILARGEAPFDAGSPIMQFRAVKPNCS